MRNPFKALTMRDKLSIALDQARDSRVQATAQMAYWQAQEQFQISEIKRLRRELSLIDDEADGTSRLPELSVRGVVR